MRPNFTEYERALNAAMDGRMDAIDEGLLGNIGNWLARKLGGDIKKVDKFIAEYDKQKTTSLSSIADIKTKAFAAKVRAQGEPEYAAVAEEMSKRAEDTVARIRKAESDKLLALNNQIREFLSDKKDRVRQYARAKIAEAQYRISDRELKDAQKYASEDELKKLEEIVANKGKIAKATEAKLNAAVKADNSETSGSSPEDAAMKKAGEALDKAGVKQELDTEEVKK